MPKSKKVNKVKQASIVRTKHFYSLKGMKIPIYALPENSLIDGEKYLPLLSELKIDGKCLVLRLEDLMPKSFLQIPSLSPIHPFGVTLYDTFKPTYGAASENSAGRFSLSYCKSYYTFSSYWFFWNVNEKPGNYFQGIFFDIDTSGIPNPHLRINFGGTNNMSAVLQIYSSIGFFHLNVAPLAYKSLNIILNVPSATVTVSLRRDENDPNNMVEIRSFELYDTIFVDPGPFHD